MPKFHYMTPMEQAKHAERYSTCKKKHLGCVLVLEGGRRINGWNGPPQQLAQCNPCPRLNSHSGTDLHLCRAVHAERRTLLVCAERGYSTYGSTLYAYMNVPCKDCLLELIMAGVKEIVCISKTYYDELSKEILAEWIENGGKFGVVAPDQESTRT